MNITIGSLYLVAQTLEVRISDLFIGVEDHAELPVKRSTGSRSSSTDTSKPPRRKR